MKSRSIIFYIVLITTIIILFNISLYKAEISDSLYGRNDDTVLIKEGSYIEDIEDGTEVGEKFVASRNNMEKIYIAFNPLKEIENVGGNATIGLKDLDSNEIIQEENIQLNHIVENTIYKFIFPKQKDSENKLYYFYIKYTNPQKTDNIFSVNYSSDTVNADRQLVINGMEREGNLSFYELYKSDLKTRLFYISIAMLTVITIGITSYIFFKKEISPETAFLIVAPIACLMFMLTMPTFKSHDELYHLIRAYEVSVGKLVTEFQENGSQGSVLPESIIKIMDTNDFTNIKYTNVLNAIKVKLEPDNKVVINSGTSAVYSPVQYIPQVIGIVLGRVFTDNTLLIMYMGRLTNCIFAIVCIYFAIKIIPFGKNLLLIMSLIPIAIEGYTSFSSDAITICIAFLFIAYILNLVFNKEKQITIGDQVLIVLLGIIIALSKIVYLPLVGLTLLLPKDKFKNNKSKNIYICITIGVATIMNLLWLKISSRYLFDFRNGDSKIQIINLLIHPIQYIQNIFYTIEINGIKYLTEAFGAVLGWGEPTRLSFVVPITYMFLSLFVAITDVDIKDKLTNYQKVICVLIILAITALIFTSLFVQWTRIGSTSIQGVQGRYFIPFMPLILIIVGSNVKVISNYLKQNITKFVSITIMILQINVILSLIISHI